MNEDLDTSEWRRKRYAYFTEIVKAYTSFENFINDWHEKMSLWGIQLIQHDKKDYITIYIQIDYYCYNEFHVIVGKDGHLTLSKGVGVKEIYANMIVDIDSKEYLDEYPEDESSEDE